MHHLENDPSLVCNDFERKSSFQNQHQSFMSCDVNRCHSFKKYDFGRNLTRSVSRETMTSSVGSNDTDMFGWEKPRDFDQPSPLWQDTEGGIMKPTQSSSKYCESEVGLASNSYQISRKRRHRDDDCWSQDFSRKETRLSENHSSIQRWAPLSQTTSNPKKVWGFSAVLKESSTTKITDARQSKARLVGTSRRVRRGAPLCPHRFVGSSSSCSTYASRSCLQRSAAELARGQNNPSTRRRNNSLESRSETSGYSFKKTYSNETNTDNKFLAVPSLESDHFLDHDDLDAVISSFCSTVNGEGDDDSLLFEKDIMPNSDFQTEGDCGLVTAVSVSPEITPKRVPLDLLRELGNGEKGSNSTKSISSKKKRPRENAAKAAAMAGADMNSFKNALDSFRGVTFRPSGKWQAQCYFEGKSRYIGVFDTREKASTAYEIAMKKLMEGGKQDFEGEDAKAALAKKIAEARAAAKNALKALNTSKSSDPVTARAAQAETK